MTPTKLQRWLDLIAFLVARRLPVTIEQLMEGIPSYATKWNTEDEADRAAARRMFERDKDELRKAGIPIRSITFSTNFGLEETIGYRIDRKDFYLPYLSVLRGEVSGEEADEPGTKREPLEGRGGTKPARRERSARREASPEKLLSRAGALDLTRREADLALESLRRVSQIPAFPLRAEARSAFRKLAFDLDPDAFAEDTPVLFADPPGAAEVLSVLKDVSGALLDRKRLAFTYHGIHRGETTQREVKPYGLLFQGGHWYLVGHDALRNDVRVFRVARIEDVKPNPRTPNTPDFEVPAEFRLDDWTGREAWELGEPEESPVRAEVRFRFPQSLWAERNGYGERVEEGDDGSVVRAFEVRQADPFVRWVLSQDGEAEIVSPPELAERLRETMQRVLDAHGGEIG